MRAFSGDFAVDISLKSAFSGDFRAIFDKFGCFLKKSPFGVRKNALEGEYG